METKLVGRKNNQTTAQTVDGLSTEGRRRVNKLTHSDVREIGDLIKLIPYKKYSVSKKWIRVDLKDMDVKALVYDIQGKEADFKEKGVTYFNDFLSFKKAVEEYKYKGRRNGKSEEK